MLVCYLDDSGKDAQNPLTTVAGYVAREAGWAAFERDVEPWFAKYEVPILHATELEHSNRTAFQGWKVIKKQSFVSRVCVERNRHAMMGFIASAQKVNYREYRERYPQASSPYTICFQIILNWVLNTVGVGKIAHEEGVAFVLEHGHENNREAEIAFEDIRGNFELEKVLRSFKSVPKNECRAIQLADLLAFCGRRDHVSMCAAREKGNARYPAEMMMKIIAEGLPHRATRQSVFTTRTSRGRLWLT